MATTQPQPTNFAPNFDSVEAKSQATSSNVVSTPQAFTQQVASGAAAISHDIVVTSQNVVPSPQHATLPVNTVTLTVQPSQIQTAQTALITANVIPSDGFQTKEGILQIHFMHSVANFEHVDQCTINSAFNCSIFNIYPYLGALKKFYGATVLILLQFFLYFLFQCRFSNRRGTVRRGPVGTCHVPERNHVSFFRKDNVKKRSEIPYLSFCRSSFSFKVTSRILCFVWSVDTLWTPGLGIKKSMQKHMRIIQLLIIDLGVFCFSSGQMIRDIFICS